MKAGTIFPELTKNYQLVHAFVYTFAPHYIEINGFNSP